MTVSEFPPEPIEEWSRDDLGRAARVCPNPMRRKAVNELLRRLRTREEGEGDE